MTNEDKQRIEQAALIEYPDRANNGIRFREYNAKERFAYMLGRTSELERSEKLLQEERNRAIDDCIEEIQKYFDKADMDTPVLLREMITYLKK